MQESVFQQYFARLRREGILKSILWGLAFGAIAAFIVALSTWLSYFKGFWLTVGIFVGVTAVVAVILYFRVFKPTAKTVARRVDALGLEERLITMLELENDDDYIAMRQREDAQAALGRLGLSKVQFGISLLLILLLAIGGAFGIGMTTVTGLSDLGVIKSGAQLIDEAQGRNPKNFITVSYTATTGGEIYGKSEQHIHKSNTTEMVVAVAKSGYRFYRWTDGNPNPARADKGLDESHTFTAWFLPTDPDGAEETPNGDLPTDQPPEDGNDNNDPPPPPNEGTVVPVYDYIVDWKTEYKKFLDDNYDKIMEDIAKDTTLSDEERQFLETYYNTIK